MEISSDDHGDMTGVDTSESEEDKVYDDIYDWFHLITTVAILENF